MQQIGGWLIMAMGPGNEFPYEVHTDRDFAWDRMNILERAEKKRGGSYRFRTSSIPLYVKE